MKLDDNSLRALYQAYVKSRKPPAGEECPATEKLLKLLRAELSPKETDKIIEHVSHCGSCAAEFKFFLEVLRKEKVFIEEAEAWLAAAKGAQGQSQRKPGILGWVRAGRPFFLRFSWRAASLLAGFAVIGAVVISLLVFRSPEKFRSDTGMKVQLLQPIGTSVDKPHLIFKWKATKDAEYYILELFDETLVPVWKSEKISRSQAVLPEDVVRKLAVKRTYFWMVTACFPDEEKIISPLEKFSLKE